MSGWEGPGEGWRRIDSRTIQPQHNEYLRHIVDGVVEQSWVREEPVPPLPTEPYTVIRVRWKHGTRGAMNHDGGLVLRSAGWVDVAGHWINPFDLAARITGFEVLAVPSDAGVITRTVAAENKRVRRETAKAVLERVGTVFDSTRDGYSVGQTIEIVAREFEVEL